MNNLKKIVELCDTPWIQDKWKPKTGDWTFSKATEMVGVVRKEWRGRYESSICVWLPLGFNPETRNYQLDDLLMEAGGFGELEAWIEFSAWVIRDVAEYDNIIIAKLTWLKQLVKEK